MKYKYSLISLPLAIFILTLLASLLIAGLYYRTTITGLVKYQYWRYYTKPTIQSGYVKNAGASIYYEMFGSGKPLVLLHGGLSSLNVFFFQIPELAQRHTVLAIDLRGQGKSNIGNSEFTYQLMADDVILVLDTLNIESADVIGWSDGGIIGLMIGLEYPERIQRLVAIGTNFNPQGLTSSALQSIQTGNAAEASLWAKLLYRLRSPHPERWEELWTRVNNMWRTRPNLTTGDLARIATPTLVVVGENDNIELSHSRELTSALIDAELVIIPKASHNLLVERPEKMLLAISTFIY